jgi:hypothetical protein
MHKKKNNKGFWWNCLEFLLEAFIIPFRLLWWIVKGIGHLLLFLVEALGEIIAAIFEGL